MSRVKWSVTIAGDRSVKSAVDVVVQQPWSRQAATRSRSDQEENREKLTREMKN